MFSCPHLVQDYLSKGNGVDLKKKKNYAKAIVDFEQFMCVCVCLCVGQFG